MVDIKIGEYVELIIDKIAYNCEPVFDGITAGVEWIVTGLQGILNFPHPIIITVLFTLLAYWLLARPYGAFTKQGWKAGRGIVIFIFVGMFLIGGMGFWEETMQTLALVIASALISLVIGIPTGIVASRSDRFEQMVRPVLDLMQTMPAFVYLIPAILFFSVGNVPGVVATVVFALPPGVRLTDLGIREVQEDVIEAARAFGCTDRQLLFKVQIPLAMTTIMAGVNQVIMLSLSMVVIASMVGAAGLGERVYTGILQADIGLGFEAGLGIVIIAIFLDRITQALGVKKSTTS
ncbi:MAG: proline/glycine betaine ABC transporter permease [Thermodesulfobacteriota bacterium]|nr:proline/glycine betaine ABC transporter permease [Thermodesulfobacteriota bacterium]